MKNEHVVAAHLGGDTIFGEIAVTSGSKRNAAIVSKSDCVLLRIQAEIFCQFLSQSSSAYQLISVMRDSRIRLQLIDDITCDIDYQFWIHLRCLSLIINEGMG